MTNSLLGIADPIDRKQRSKRLTLFGNFGPGNFGNDATLKTILHHLRQHFPDAKIMCICTDPEAVTSSSKIASAPIRQVFVSQRPARNPIVRACRLLFIGIPLELYRWIMCFITLREVDALIIPGTGLLTDAYGLVHWGPYSIFQWSLAAKLSGCKLLFISVGAGPLYGRLGRYFVKVALALADFRSYRDADSRECLDSIGVATADDHVSPDLVFSLPDVGIPDDLGRDKRRVVVGIGLMGCAGRLSGEKPKSSIYQNYLESLLILVGWLLAREYDLRLLIGDVGDTLLLQQFRCLISMRFPMYDSRRIIAEPAASVEQILSQMANTDVVVATRFHNVLFAMLLDKPVISISFHHKCVSLMRQMGLSEYCLDIEELNAEQLIERFCRLEPQLVGIKRMIRDNVRACRDALDEQYATIFRRICPDGESAPTPATEM